jgi:hypothetical protein
VPTISAYAQFTKPSGSQQVPATGLTVTCTLYAVKRSDQSIASASPTPFEIGGGLYGITYSTSVDLTQYDYLANFATTDGTVAQTKIAGGVFLNPADVQDVTVPAEAAGRPTGLVSMIRRIFEWHANKRTRDRSTGAVLLRNAADNGTLETQNQSTAGTVDTQTQGV